eukprot:jgi/Phyca11/114619/e_gw1.26.472.1
MPSVHFVGELLGASGLYHQEAFSVAHILDLLSLHPSSGLSYFCKWRIVVESPSKSQQDGWKVIQGETRGQTQVHSATSGGSLAMPNFYRQSSDKNKRTLLSKMDTVWAHPIDLHISTSLDTWSFWPQLEFQVRF